jgi:hypothetical protein
MDEPPEQERNAFEVPKGEYKLNQLRRFVYYMNNFHKMPCTPYVCDGKIFFKFTDELNAIVTEMYFSSGVEAWHEL